MDNEIKSMTEEPISAISTPAGTGGVAIIRVSGAGAKALAGKMFAPAGKTRVEDFEPNRMYAGKILCGEKSEAKRS